MKRRILSMLLGGILTITTVLGSLPASTLSVEAAGELDTYVTDDSNLSTEEVDAPPKDTTLPTANQYQYQKDELAAFCHFGPNTFNDVEWGEDYGNSAPDEIFGLTEDFDAETLVKTIYNAGFKKLIVTAKHHDGFCIWQSDYTDYDIESTQYWRDREQKRKETNSEIYGDVLAEISAACTKYDIDMGLYLSPWDIHEPSYGYFKEDGTPITDETERDQDAKDYNEFYNNQLQEILGNDIYGNNGHFVEIWMDGANGAKSGMQYAQEYDFDTWFRTIQTNEGTLNTKKNYESDCMLFGAGDKTTVRWIGNESGEAAPTTWSKSKVLEDTYGDLHIFNDPSQSTDKFDINGNKNTGYYKGDPTDGYSNGYETGNHWTVPEVDATIIKGWFWNSNKADHTPISSDSLANMYFNSVGRGAVLLLNIPPNTQGKIDDEIVERVEEFGSNIQETFRNNLAAAEDAVIYASSVYKNNAGYKPGNVVDGNDSTYWTVSEDQKEGSLIVKWDTAKTFDVVSIEEAIQNGQRINHYKVEYKATDDQADWTLLEEGVTVGSKRLVRKAPVKATQVKITVGIGNYPVANETTLTSNPTDILPEKDVTPRIPMLSEIGIYKASDGFSLGTGAPDSMEFIGCDDNSITYSGNWHPQTGSDYINGHNTYSSEKDAYFTFEFTGSKIYLLGTRDPGHGKGEVYIDGTLAATIETKADSRRLGQQIFVSEDLEHGTHTVKVVVKESGRAIGFEAAYVINNEGQGLLELEKSVYTTNEGCDVAVKVNRVGGSKGELKATLYSDVGSAIQRHFNTGLTTELTFADGETTKYIPAAAQTYRNEEADGNVYFFIRLSGDNLGITSSARVTIKDAENITEESFEEFVQECSEYSISMYTGEGWEAFKTALSSARAVAADENATLEQKQAAYIALDEALAKLTERSGFTEEDPFIFPSVVDETEVLEAEMGKIVNVTDGDGGWPMEVSTANWASNGAFVNAMNANDSLEIPYYAAETGIYEVTLTYKSGDVNNGLQWESDPKGNVKEGTVTAGASGVGDTHKKIFEVEITKAGKGILIFHGAETYNAPQTDKFDITLKKANVDFTALKELIAGIDVTQYEGRKTPESIQALKDAIAEGKALYADETAEAAATQTKINKAVEAIKAAVEGLKVLEVYEILEGKNENYTTGQDGTFTLRASGSVDKFVSVKVDGKVVDPKYYTIRSGSTIVTFTKEYMEYLSTGKHTIDVVFTDGVASTSLTVAEKVADSPAPPTGTDTGDSSNKDSSAGNSSNGSASAGNSSAAGTATGTGAKTGDPAEISMMMALCLAAAVLIVFAGTERRKVK